MDRRKFIKDSVALAAASQIGGIALAGETPSDRGSQSASAGDRDSVIGKAASAGSTACSLGDTLVRIYSDGIREPVKLMLIADTHLFMSDSREDPYRYYSERMSKAYNKTRDFQTQEESDPQKEFVKTLGKAKEVGVDAIFHLGDLVSYPSEAGIEWAKEQLDATGIPWHYTTGNHDWHYEGMAGSEIDLREEWTAKRLAPLYKGENHLLYTVNVKGLKVLMLDNSVYEILPEQLELFRREMREGKPSLMMSHIPFYAPGFSVGWGCGHPDWNAASDRNAELERRPRWPEAGHTRTTFDFWKEIIRSHEKRNLLATFAGHVHGQSSSVVQGWPQFTLKGNFSGAYNIVEVLPMKDLK